MSEKAPKKGTKVPTKLEFEQKFLLDARQWPAILNQLCTAWGSLPGILPLVELTNPKPGITAYEIRQYYDNGDRFRHSGDVWGNTGRIEPEKYEKEVKKSIYLNTPYTANMEDSEETTADQFEKGWDKSKRRLQKIRFRVPSVHDDHRTIVDFFYTLRNGSYYVYAVVAEDEAMLDHKTTDLYLKFELPIFLSEYLICLVDNRDPAMKFVRSANMIDTPDAIEAFERAISQWYGNSI